LDGVLYVPQKGNKGTIKSYVGKREAASGVNKYHKTLLRNDVMITTAWALPASRLLFSLGITCPLVYLQI